MNVEGSKSTPGGGDRDPGRLSVLSGLGSLWEGLVGNMIVQRRFRSRGAMGFGLVNELHESSGSKDQKSFSHCLIESQRKVLGPS